MPTKTATKTTAKPAAKKAKPVTPEQAAKNRAATNAARAAVKLAAEQVFSSGSSGHMVRGTATVNGRQAWVSTTIVYKDSVVKKSAKV